MLHLRSHVNRSELVIFRSVIEITHMKTNGDQGVGGGAMERRGEAAGQPGSYSARSPRAEGVPGSW